MKNLNPWLWLARKSYKFYIKALVLICYGFHSNSSFKGTCIVNIILYCIIANNMCWYLIRTSVTVLSVERVWIIFLKVSARKSTSQDFTLNKRDSFREQSRRLWELWVLVLVSAGIVLCSLVPVYGVETHCFVSETMKRKMCGRKRGTLEPWNDDEEFFFFFRGMGAKLYLVFIARLDSCFMHSE